MTLPDKPIELVHVPCEICLKEVPASEATVCEAADYVAYFCGLDCCEQWKKRAANTAGSPADKESL